MCSSNDALGNLLPVDDAECAVSENTLNNLLPVDDAECTVSDDVLGNLLPVDDVECAVPDGTLDYRFPRMILSTLSGSTKQPGSCSSLETHPRTVRMGLFIL